MMQVESKAQSDSVYGSNGIVGFHNISNSKGPGIVVGRAGNPGTVHWSNEDFFQLTLHFLLKLKTVTKVTFIIMF